jgi:hypothetical protein
MDDSVPRNRVRLRFNSPTTKIKDVIRVPSKKSLLYERECLRLTLRTKTANMETIDEYDEWERDSVECEQVFQNKILAWLTDDVFVYNTPAELEEKQVEVLLDTFLKLGFKRLSCASIQPQS